MKRLFLAATAIAMIQPALAGQTTSENAESATTPNESAWEKTSDDDAKAMQDSAKKTDKTAMQDDSTAYDDEAMESDDMASDPMKKDKMKSADATKSKSATDDSMTDDAMMTPETPTSASTRQAGNADTMQADELNADETLTTPTKTAATTKATTATAANVHLASNSVGMKELLGAPITNDAGERVGRVDDFRINADGKVDKLIFLSGGVFGLGGKKGSVDFSKVELGVTDEQDPRVAVPFTKANIKSATAYEEDEANDFQLASELVGASASLSQSDDRATVSDLIVKESGEVEYAIVQNGVVGSLGGDQRAVTFNNVAIAQGDGGVTVNLTPAQLEGKPKFDYKRTEDMSANDVMNDEKKAMKDDAKKDKKKY